MEVGGHEAPAAVPVAGDQQEGSGTAPCTVPASCPRTPAGCQELLQGQWHGQAGARDHGAHLSKEEEESGEAAPRTQAPPLPGSP